MSASVSSLAKMARVISPAAMAMASTSTSTSSSSSSTATVQPLPPADTHDYWNRDSTSVSAVSFGFVATAVLISLFLIVAIFERFLRRAPSSDMDLNNNNSSRRDSDHGAFRPFTCSQGQSEPPFEQYPATEISVLMPGQKVPTFIANPAPMPCSLKGMLHSSHGDGTLESCSFDHTRSTNGHPSKPENEENGTALV